MQYERTGHRSGHEQGLFMLVEVASRRMGIRSECGRRLLLTMCRCCHAGVDPSRPGGMWVSAPGPSVQAAHCMWVGTDTSKPGESVPYVQRAYYEARQDCAVLQGALRPHVQGCHVTCHDGVHAPTHVVVLQTFVAYHRGQCVEHGAMALCDGGGEQGLSFHGESATGPCMCRYNV